jgi:hypothetical protein
MRPSICAAPQIAEPFLAINPSETAVTNSALHRRQQRARCEINPRMLRRRRAVVRDENATHRGKIDIGHWITTTIEKYKFQFKPLSSQERDNETVVSVEVSGTFPGSPISLDYHFAIANDKIASLTIDS